MILFCSESSALAQYLRRLAWPGQGLGADIKLCHFLGFVAAMSREFLRRLSQDPDSLADSSAQIQILLYGFTGTVNPTSVDQQASLARPTPGTRS